MAYKEIRVENDNSSVYVKSTRTQEENAILFVIKKGVKDISLFRDKKGLHMELFLRDRSLSKQKTLKLLKKIAWEIKYAPEE